MLHLNLRTLDGLMVAQLPVSDDCTVPATAWDFEAQEALNRYLETGLIRDTLALYGKPYITWELAYK